MQHSEAVPIGELIMTFFQINDLEKKILERRIIKSWKTLMGNSISQMTKSIELKNGILTLYITNAALKQELFENRGRLIKKINSSVGKSVVTGIKIYG